jgi:D-tyrosyl-tRNA(Tyr) deacylase
MRAVCQRVSEARVTVDGADVAQIREGLVVLLGVARGDSAAVALRLAGKIARARIFEDDAGRFDRSLLDIGGSSLVVSQFTLLGDSRRGTRPDFSNAAPASLAEPLYERFCDALRDLGIPVQTGLFGARMAVELVNQGPVTIIVDVEGQR